MRRMVIAVLHLLALALTAVYGTEDNATNLMFTVDCDPSISTCKSSSLEDIAISINASMPRGVIISIKAESITLTSTATFENIPSVAILGEGSQITCNSSQSGLSFLSVSHITIEDIKIVNCGTVVNIGNKNVQSAIYFSNYSQITIQCLTVAHSNGSGLHFDHAQGYLRVTDSSFVNNTLQSLIQERYGWIDGGNGVRLYVKNSVGMSKIIFENCNFTQNKANGIAYNFLFSTPGGLPKNGNGRGGGMGITLLAGRAQVKVILKGCSFTQNSAYLGGGLSAQIKGGNRSSYYEVLIEDTVFATNGCPSETQGGGGAYLSFERLTKATNHTISLVRVTFDYNCAGYGGGIYFFSSPLQMPNNNIMQFTDSSWMKNSASIGSAVYVTPDIFYRTESRGNLPKPRFRNCSFINNSIQVSNNLSVHQVQKTYESGTLYSSLVSIVFESSVLFEDNYGSAIMIVNGVANFAYSNATFIRNQGLQGGAMQLIGTTSMLVGAGQEYKFVNNTAIDKGGAIFSRLVDDSDVIVSRSCFLQYKSKENKSRVILPTSNWTATLTFEGNNAKSQIGNSIYATTVIPCQVVSTSNRIFKAMKVTDIFQAPGIVGISNDTNDISTEVAILIPSNSEHLKAIPGKAIELGVEILDDFGNKVGAKFTAYMRKGNIMVDSRYSSIPNQTIQFTGKEGETGELVLQTLGSRKHSLGLPVDLLHCPPGYTLDQEKCICDINAYIGTLDCQGYTAYLMPGFWAGYVNLTDHNRNSKQLATSICPEQFCNYNGTDFTTTNQVRLPSDGADLDEAMCGKKRKGVLCGECRENFTNYYHSPNMNCNETKPYSCKIGWLFYILSELVPVTVLFLLVLVLNISFTTGAVNGFVLFSQLLDTLLINTSSIITFSPPITVLSTVYKVIYGFFNLDFFNIEPLSFCIWENASVLDMLSFKYITIAYSLLLVLGVIFFMRYCAARCLGRYYSITSLRNSVIHGLSAFLVLCYGQCIKVSFSILYRQKLTLRQNLTVQGTSLHRVWFNGNVEYFSNEHLRYALPAFFILLTIGVIPPLVLLVYPLFNRVFAFFKLEDLSIVRCFNRIGILKPLLDSFQGSFKDDFRFFAGIYFFYRWTAVVVYAAVSSYYAFFSIVQALLVGILTIHSLFQPYQKRWHNILDGLLLANLIVINGFNAVHYYQVRVYRSQSIDEIRASINTTGAIQLILIYLPLIYITLYTIVCILGKTVCKGTKEDPLGGRIILKKIYRKTSTASESNATIEESLPYRLVGREDTSFFENSEKSTITMS